MTKKFIPMLMGGWLALSLTQCTDVKTDATMTKPESQPEKLLRHVVLFKFKDSSAEESIEELHAAFNALPGAIPAIQDFEWGMNDSPEDFHQGFTHCYILTFRSKYDRDSLYTPSPHHQAFVKSLQPHLEKVFVVDFWANPATKTAGIN